ncbi:MAG: DUF362 domain-containing protein [Chloroflexi bacterium]|jgi:hypothetical protein|nr:DUF362 domain-containing protein [Chloroflexota bacterium]
MIYEASKFVFEPPSLVSRAHKILIKPNASYPYPYPFSTSREMLGLVIDKVKQVSDADIIVLEGAASGDPVYPNYKSLGYDFQRVMMLDVKDCIWVEIENPLPHPFAVATFWVPNVVLSCDFLITISSLRTIGNQAFLSIKNLLSLLPVNKYRKGADSGWGSLDEFGWDKVYADLYFTLPFDLAIVDGRKKFSADDGSFNGTTESLDKIFEGEPYEIDREVSAMLGVDQQYLDIIKAGKNELGS